MAFQRQDLFVRYLFPERISEEALEAEVSRMIRTDIKSDLSRKGLQNLKAEYRMCIAPKKYYQRFESEGKQVGYRAVLEAVRRFLENSSRNGTLKEVTYFRNNKGPRVSLVYDPSRV